MALPLAVEQPAPLPQRTDDRPVGVLEPLAVDLVDQVLSRRILGASGRVERDPSLRVDGLELGQAVLATAAQVVLPEQRRGVHGARPLGEGHVVREQNAEAGAVRHIGGPVGAPRFDREGPVVEQTLEGPAGEARDGAGFPEIDSRRLAVAGQKHGDRLLQAIGDEQQPFRVRRVFHGAVGQVGMHGDAGVGEQGPRRRRPGDDVDRPVGAELARDGLAGPQREAHPDRRILGVAVVLRHLMARQGGAAAGAVGLDLPAFVEQVLFPEFGQRPPLRLDVGVPVGQVGAVHVEPVADPLGHPPPLPLVGADALEAGAVELLDPVVLDLLLAGEAELLLDLDLDRQSVRVPAALARHAPTGHRAKARVEVLHHPGDDVADVRHVVRGRRPLVEGELLFAALVASLKRGFEHPLATPELQRLALELGEGIAAGNGRKRGIPGHGEGLGRGGRSGGEALALDERRQRRRELGRSFDVGQVAAAVENVQMGVRHFL